MNWYVFEVLAGTPQRPETLELLGMLTATNATQARRQGEAQWPRPELMIQSVVSYDHDRHKSKVRARHCLPVRYHNRKVS